MALVCHAPGALREAKATNGDPLVKGKSATGFSNAEEAAIGLTKVVPFLVEEALKSNGAHYSKTEYWRPHVVVDGNLITGQNPASSAGVAHAVLDQLRAAGPSTRSSHYAAQGLAAASNLRESLI